MSDRPDVRVSREVDGAWHRAINDLQHPFESNPADRFDPAKDGMRFMYEAKRAASEVPRLALLFSLERRGKLRKVHHQCSRDHGGTPVEDNHLTCCLGVACRSCPFLGAIDQVQTHRRYERVDGQVRGVEEPISDEERDVLKAWTCATHIISRGGDQAGEGYILTTDDRMYWDNVYASLSSGMG